MLRRATGFTAVIVLIGVAYGLSARHAQSRGKASGKRILYYVDPMHPSYKSDKPGAAPDCGMPLQPVFGGDTRTEPPATPAESDGGTVMLDSATREMLGIRLATAESGGAGFTIRAVGHVTPEDARVYKINSGVEGFVRETYQDSVGVRVAKNQKLASYYTPEFLAAASGYLAASERVQGAVAREGIRGLQNYADRLRNLGMSDLQIEQIAASRKLPDSIDAIAPVDGFILARNISPGQHIEHGAEFYRIADLSRVWVVVDLYEQQASFVRDGAKARLRLRDQGRTLTGTVLPELESAAGVVKRRVEVGNPDFVLRPDSLVDVAIPVTLPAALTVPSDAVVDSGAGTRVYVDEGNGAFRPREVETGWRSADRVEIRKGLRPGDRVVAGATFLVDSESRLKSVFPRDQRLSVSEKARR